MLVFFTNLGLMEFQVRYLALFFLFSVIDDFRWFWMGSLLKNIQLMLEFLKGPLLVLHFSYYTLMTFLMILSVILLYMLMILCMEYCCHVWTGAPSCYLELLDRLQKWICMTVGLSLAVSLELLVHRQNLASLSLFYR